MDNSFMDLTELLNQIRRHPDCKIHPPNGQPKIGEEDHRLPDDVLVFYEISGGLELFKTAEYPYSILDPEKFTRANPIIVPDDWRNPEWDNHISSSWYIIGADPDGQLLTIDLDPLRLGRCYDSFIGQHGADDSELIISFSFTDLLFRLWKNKGGYPYWLKPDFVLTEN